MLLSHAQVEHIARLARLNLTPEEIERYTTELTVILDYIDQLKLVNTEGVEPQNQFIKAENVFRDDVAEPSLPREKALGNAPQQDGEYFLVPKVIGG
jgi:aspartyl-tRNA(Asn)/glutamyl-tRNA(Gln) amidotransferase subunit C